MQAPSRYDEASLLEAAYRTRHLRRRRPIASHLPVVAHLPAGPHIDLLLLHLLVQMPVELALRHLLPQSGVCATAGSATHLCVLLYYAFDQVVFMIKKVCCRGAGADEINTKIPVQPQGGKGNHALLLIFRKF